jgi:hypothetical protein
MREEITRRRGCCWMVAVSAGLLACRGGGEQRGAASRAARPVPAEMAGPGLVGRSDPDPAAVQWTTHTIEGQGISFAAFAGVTVHQGTLGDSAYARFQLGSLQAALWLGPGRGLASWRQGLGTDGEFGSTSAVAICGGAGTRQEARVVAQTLVRAPVQSDRRLATQAGGRPRQEPAGGGTTREGELILPPRTIVAMAFTRGSVPAIATWTVPTERRARYRELERQFFAAIRCL